MNATTHTKPVSQAEPKKALVHVNPADLLFASNVRASADSSNLGELVQSVATYGVMQPITVQQTKLGYQVLYGHRRAIAAKLANLPSVPCLIDVSPEEERVARQLVENVQRQDLKLGEAAVAMRKLYDEHGSLALVAEMVGKSKSWACKMLALTANVDGQTKRTFHLVLDEEITDLEMAHALAQIEKTNPSRVDMDDLIDQIRAGKHNRETLREILTKINGRKLKKAVEQANPHKPMSTELPPRSDLEEDLATCLNSAMDLLRDAADAFDEPKARTDDKEFAAEIRKRLNGFAKVLNEAGY